MNEILEEKHVEIEQQEERNAAMERKRKYQLKMKREREEALKQSVQCKIDEEEAALKHLEEQRRKEQMLLKAERDLQKQLKKETLDRIKRKREYQMRETMKKVEENDKRSNELKKKKEELLRLRKKSAHESKVKKDKLMAVIEQSKTSGGSSAIKKILRKISMNEDMVVDLTPAKSRNISSNSVSDEMDDSILSMDPPPEAPSFAKRMVKDDSTAMPYQSPYQSPYITDTDFSDFKSMKI